MCQNTYGFSAAALSLHTNHVTLFWLNPSENHTDLSCITWKSIFPPCIMYIHHWQAHPGRVCWRCWPQCSAASWGHPPEPNCPGCQDESVWKMCKLPLSVANLDLLELTQKVLWFWVSYVFQSGTCKADWRVRGITFGEVAAYFFP